MLWSRIKVGEIQGEPKCLSEYFDHLDSAGHDDDKYKFSSAVVTD